MHILVAGATGALGRPLVRILVDAGHEVTGLARRATTGRALEAAGASPLAVDLLDGDARGAIVAARPDVVVHAATALSASLLNPVSALRSIRRTNALRREGTATLAEGARAAGARLISASITMAYRPGAGRRTEADPLWTDAPGLGGSVNGAVGELEKTTLDVAGTVLRFGSFHGADTYYAPGGAFVEMIRRRMLPIIDDGSGTYTFVHVEDAARAVVASLEAPTGVYNIVDPRSALLASEWIPIVAEAVGAKPPRRLPRALANHGPGRLLTYLIADQPAVSTAHADRMLTWRPSERPWRDEFLAQIGR